MKLTCKTPPGAGVYRELRVLRNGAQSLAAFARYSDPKFDRIEPPHQLLTGGALSAGAKGLVSTEVSLSLHNTLVRSDITHQRRAAKYGSLEAILVTNRL